MKTGIRIMLKKSPSIRTLVDGDVFTFENSTKQWIFLGYNESTKGYEYYHPDNSEVIGVIMKLHRKSILLK